MRKIVFSVLITVMLVSVMIAPVAHAAKPPAGPVQLPGKNIPKFIDPLPVLSVAGGTMNTIIDVGTQIELHMGEFKANILPTTTPFILPNGLTYSGTWVWGYQQGATPTTTQDTYIGPVVVATRSDPVNAPSPTRIRWVNDLPTTANTNLTFIKNPANPLASAIDQTLHWANPQNLPWPNDPGRFLPYSGPIAAVPHLHGGEVPPQIDGGPDAWFYRPADMPTDLDVTLNNTGDMVTFTAGVNGATVRYKVREGSVVTTPTSPPDPATITLNQGDTITFSLPVNVTKAKFTLFINAGAVTFSIVGTATVLPWSSTGHAYYSLAGTGNDGSATYVYPNTQEAAPIWFHDHLLGATRLNVYAGLAGAYLIQDSNLSLPLGLTALGLDRDSNGTAGDEYTIPLVIQDRMFDTNGQLFFPNLGINPLNHPYWIPEFVGDTIVVNGKSWPYLAVDKCRYRFLLLNGSNARAYDMFLQDTVSGIKGPRMWVIATDGGYLDSPVLIDPNATGQQVKAGIQKSLVIMPGERYEVIIDFNDPVWNQLLQAAGLQGQPINLTLRNTAKTPYPNGAPPVLQTTGTIMQFRVSATVRTDSSFNPAVGLTPPPIRPVNKKIVRLTNGGVLNVTPTLTRLLTLNEVMGLGGPLSVLVNNTYWDGLSLDSNIDPNGIGFPGGIRPDFTAVTTAGGETYYYSEVPNEGDTEVWEIVNLTADAHPIHLHLVQFQLISRQAFDVKAYNAAYNGLFPGGGLYIPGYGPPKLYNFYTDPANIPAGGRAIYGGNPDVVPYLVGAATPPLLSEAGWKDTVIMYPGQVTRIVVRWAPTDVAAGATGNFPFDPNGGHGYVWHCHIIDHEDNEMMRPTQVTPTAGATRSIIMGIGY